MKTLTRFGAVALTLLAMTGCERDMAGPKADAVLLELSPDVVSSEDGSLHARAVVVEGSTPLRGWTVQLQVTFTDQLGTLRTVQGDTAETDRTGAFEHTFEGLYWAGAGTITAEVLDGDGEPYVGRGDVPVVAEATFSVIDRSPPTVTIEPPTSDLRVGRDLPLDVQVSFSDEIGVSSVTIQAVGELSNTQTRIVASGSSSGSVVFDFDVPGAAIPGPTITLYALAEDLSGNVAAASALTLTVDPAIEVAVPPGFAASPVAAEAANFLQAPRAIVFSPRDEMLYVADGSGGATCAGQCIWRIDPANGGATLLTVGLGPILGLAVDANGDNLYFSEPDRIVRMTYNAGAQMYGNAAQCNDPAGNPPAAPFHLLVDGATLLLAEQSDQTLKTLDVTDCLGVTDTSDPVDLSAGLDTPWGVAQAPGGDYLVSDEALDRVFSVAADGSTAMWEFARLDQPRGIEWIAGGASTFADSLLIASQGDRRVYSSRGNGTSRTAVSLTTDPIDVALGSGTYVGTLFVLTEGNGRIFAVTGYQ